MPRYQGELDGLCGLYAVANAFEFCFAKDPSRSFEFCAQSLASSRWPAVLWEGTTFGDVRRMIAKCRQEHGLRKKLRVQVPFWKRFPKNDGEFWQQFDSQLNKDNVLCALIGIEKPRYHWILATVSKNDILLLDSTAGETLALVNRKKLYAGARRPKKDMWLINPRELIIFEKR
ncbi:MAG: hypothetical protein WBJ21_15985 [Burkholderiaceae bacterium]